MRIKLLFDQNLSYKLCKRLEDLFPESSHTRMLNLAQTNDDKIWEYAKENGYTIVTKDSDFNDISMIKGFPPHIIWLRIGNSSLRGKVAESPTSTGRWSVLSEFSVATLRGSIPIFL